MRSIAVGLFTNDDEAQRLGLDDLLITVASQEVVAERITRMSQEIPAVLANSIACGKRELTAKIAAEEARLIQKLRAEIDGLASRSERINSARAKLTELEAKQKARAAGATQ